MKKGKGMADTMDTIESIDVDRDRFMDLWGVCGREYRLNGKVVDFQDLMVFIAEQRATSIEGEVSPLSRRIRTRNTQLEQLGTTLSALSNLTSQYKTDSDNPNPSVNFTFNAETLPGFHLVGKFTDKTAAFTQSVNKATCDEITQLIKTKIDALNNASQTDMSRLQSLVDHRDQSYTTATSLMTSVSDTRTNLIKNL